MKLADTLSTDRLLLRPAVTGDRAAIVALLSDFEVVRMTASVPYPYRDEHADRWIGETVDRSRDNGARAIICNGTLVGVIGFAPSSSAIAEIGYWLGRAYWGRGIMSEAGKAMIDDVFLYNDLAEIRATTFVDNPASGRVLSKLGFAETDRGFGTSLARGDDRIPEVRMRLMRETVSALEGDKTRHRSGAA
ncbi:MAG: GNAT family N-acetyltransferase [Pseudomonadota bacterium]